MAGRSSRKRTAPARLREGKLEVRKFVNTHVAKYHVLSFVYDNRLHFLKNLPFLP